MVFLAIWMEINVNKIVQKANIKISIHTAVWFVIQVVKHVKDHLPTVRHVKELVDQLTTLNIPMKILA